MTELEQLCEEYAEANRKANDLALRIIRKRAEELERSKNPDTTTGSKPSLSA